VSEEWRHTTTSTSKSSTLHKSTGTWFRRFPKQMSGEEESDGGSLQSLWKTRWVRRTRMAVWEAWTISNTWRARRCGTRIKNEWKKKKPKTKICLRKKDTAVQEDLLSTLAGKKKGLTF
jgi:hypothetical protein